VTKRKPVEPAPGPLEDYARRFDHLLANRAQTPASVGTTSFIESQNVRKPVPVVDDRSHQFWSYSLWRRNQKSISPSSFRPIGVRSSRP
jgi:hypothetical protein